MKRGSECESRERLAYVGQSLELDRSPAAEFASLHIRVAVPLRVKNCVPQRFATLEIADSKLTHRVF